MGSKTAGQAGLPGLGGNDVPAFDMPPTTNVGGTALDRLLSQQRGAQQPQVGTALDQFLKQQRGAQGPRFPFQPGGDTIGGVQAYPQYPQTYTPPPMQQPQVGTALDQFLKQQRGAQQPFAPFPPGGDTIGGGLGPRPPMFMPQMGRPYQQQPQITPEIANALRLALSGTTKMFGG